MEALGRTFNVIPLASGKRVSLKNASAVTYVCYEDGGAQALTVEEYNGTANQALSVVDKFYAADGIGGVFSTNTRTAATNPIVKADTTPFDAMVFTIEADELSDGYTHVEVTADAGVCIAIIHELAVQRSPQNLPAAAIAG